MAAALFAQDPPPPAQFEVASIKPSPPGSRGTTFYDPTPDRFEFANTTIKGLIAYAYSVPAFQVVGATGWVAADGYDILAKPQGAVTDERVREMVQSILAERFNLKVHEEQKEMPVYALVVAKGGSKLQRSPRPDQPTARSGYGRFSGEHLAMENLVSLLAAEVERPVIDKTGIDGQFDVKVQWTPEESPDTGPSIFTAVQEQLGLKLEARHAPQDVVVIDHIDRPSEN